MTLENDSRETDPLIQREPQTEEEYYELAQQVVKLFRVLPFLMVGVFMASLDNSIVAAAYVPIGSEFNHFNDISWIATSYLLTLTAFQPLYGSLSDIFGRKAALIAAYSIFSLGCILCACSQNILQLSLSRALSGIGGGGLTTTVSVLLSDLIPLRDRGTWQGILNIVFALGSGLGAPFGGFCAERIGWRWAFAIQVPLGIIATVGVASTLFYPPRPAHLQNAKGMSSIRRVDFAGCITLVVGVTSLLVALDQGGNKLPWSDWKVLLALAIFVVFLIAFMLIEWKFAVEPVAPLRVLKNRSNLAAFFANFFHMVATFVLIFNYPLYFQAIYDYSPSRSGAHLIPAIVFSSIGSLTAGAYMKKFGSYYRFTLFSYLFMIAGFSCLMSMNGKNSFIEYLLFPIPVGFGGGIAITTTLIAIIASSGRADQAKATGLSYLFRATGQVTGLAISASILQNTLRIGLASHLKGKDAVYYAKRIRQDVHFIRQLDSETRQVVVGVFIQSLRWCFGFGLVASVCSLLVACFIRQHKLQG